MKTSKDTTSTVSKSLMELRKLTGRKSMTQEQADKYVENVKKFKDQEDSAETLARNLNRRKGS